MPGCTHTDHVNRRDTCRAVISFPFKPSSMGRHRGICGSRSDSGSVMSGNRPLAVLFLSIAVFTEVKDTEFSTWETVPAEMRGLLNKETFQFVIALLKRCGELGIDMIGSKWLPGGGSTPCGSSNSVFFLEDTISSWWGSPAWGGVDIRGSKVASRSRKATGKDPLL